MSFECRHMLNGLCQKRKLACAPGEPGCVIFGKYTQPLSEPAEPKKSVKPAKEKTAMWQPTV